MLHLFRLCLLLMGGSASAQDAFTEARRASLDSSTEPVKSCEWREMPKVIDGITIVSWAEAAKICEMANASLGRQVAVGVFRDLLKASAFLSLKGAGQKEQLAYQLLEIIDARGLTDPRRMKETLNLAFKAYVGSNGRVTPKDLNVALRKSGLGKTLSDEGFVNLAAMISVEKRNRGE